MRKYSVHVLEAFLRRKQSPPPTPPCPVCAAAASGGKSKFMKNPIKELTQHKSVIDKLVPEGHDFIQACN